MKPKIGDTLYSANIFLAYRNQVHYASYTVTRHTPKGYFVCYKGHPEVEFFIGDNWVRRRAYPTKQCALESRIARHEKYLKILKDKTLQVFEELKTAKEALKELNEVKLLPAPKC